jgi:hypothetical protein
MPVLAAQILVAEVQLEQAADAAAMPAQRESLRGKLNSVGFGLVTCRSSRYLVRRAGNGRP